MLIKFSRSGTTLWLVRRCTQAQAWWQTWTRKRCQPHFHSHIWSAYHCFTIVSKIHIVISWKKYHQAQVWWQTWTRKRWQQTCLNISIFIYMTISSLFCHTFILSYHDKVIIKILCYHIVKITKYQVDTVIADVHGSDLEFFPEFFFFGHSIFRVISFLFHFFWRATSFFNFFQIHLGSCRAALWFAWSCLQILLDFHLPTLIWHACSGITVKLP